MFTVKKKKMISVNGILISNEDYPKDVKQFYSFEFADEYADILENSEKLCKEVEKNEVVLTRGLAKEIDHVLRSFFKVDEIEPNLKVATTVFIMIDFS